MLPTIQNQPEIQIPPVREHFRVPQCDVPQNTGSTWKQSTSYIQDIKFFLQDKKVWENCICQHNFRTQKGGSFEHFWRFWNAGSICCHWHTNDAFLCFSKNKLLIAIVKGCGNLFNKRQQVQISAAVDPCCNALDNNRAVLARSSASF